MTAVSEITLEQLLDAREQRVGKQKKLMEKFMLSLVSVTVIVFPNERMF